MRQKDDSNDLKGKGDECDYYVSFVVRRSITRLHKGTTTLVLAITAAAAENNVQSASSSRDYCVTHARPPDVILRGCAHMCNGGTLSRTKHVLMTRLINVFIGGASVAHANNENT